jgi:DNA polymerase-3 subunit beta
MLLKCHRSTLTAALQTVAGVVPSRTPKEILRNIKLQVSGGRTVLIGTDQEIGIRHEVSGVETDSTGEVLLPTTRVISILKELNDETVQLHATERSLIVKGGHAEFNLSTEDPAEFPPVQAFEDLAYYAVPSKTLKELIRRTIFATDIESTRYALGGVLLEIGADKATLAATDSRRLAVAVGPAQIIGDVQVENAMPVVPSKAMSLIERSLPDSDEQALIAIHSNNVLVRSGGTTIYSRLVEGRFPRYADVIPLDFTAQIDLVVSPFYSAVRQAQIITNDESRGVDFQFAAGRLTLSSRAADIGQSMIELPISYEGPAITITFDPKFVADFLRILGGVASVKLNLIDGESPAVFSTDDGYRYVVMPLSRDQ